MSNVAIMVLTDTEGGESLGRIVNALTAAKEYKEAGDDVQVIFTGAGTKWLGELLKVDNDLRGLFNELKENVTGACSYCVTAFGVADAVNSAGVSMLEQYGTNMSYRELTENGAHVLTF